MYDSATSPDSRSARARRSRRPPGRTASGKGVRRWRGTTRRGSVGRTTVTPAASAGRSSTSWACGVRLIEFDTHARGYTALGDFRLGHLKPGAEVGLRRRQSRHADAQRLARGRRPLVRRARPRADHDRARLEGRPRERRLRRPRGPRREAQPPSSARASSRATTTTPPARGPDGHHERDPLRYLWVCRCVVPVGVRRAAGAGRERDRVTSSSCTAPPRVTSTASSGRSAPTVRSRGRRRPSTATAGCPCWSRW